MPAASASPTNSASDPLPPLNNTLGTRTPIFRVMAPARPCVEIFAGGHASAQILDLSLVGMNAVGRDQPHGYAVQDVLAIAQPRFVDGWGVDARDREPLEVPLKKRPFM